MTTPMARTWLRLHAVHHAFHRRTQLSAAAARDLDLILQRLPPAWRDHVEDVAPHPHSLWYALSHPHEERQIFSGPDYNFSRPHERHL